jgi:hypothetical protein
VFALNPVVDGPVDELDGSAVGVRELGTRAVDDELACDCGTKLIVRVFFSGW